MENRPDDNAAVETEVFTVSADAVAGDDERQYLLRVDGGSSSIYEVPAHGMVLIGRAPGADIRIDSARVSRRHAELSCSAGVARIVDLESQNGTFVNGEPLVGQKVLASGDVVTIAGANLIYNASRRGPPPRTVIDLDDLVQRIDEEVERAVRYGRSFAIVALAFATPVTDRIAAERALAAVLRRIDHVAWSGTTQLLVLMPEIAHRSGEGLARRAVDALRSGWTVRASYALCPGHGSHASDLLASLRGVLALSDDEIVSAGRAFRTIELGSATAIVADEAMTRLYALIERLAASDLPVLVQGETGTGKELAATAVHHFSPRREGKLVTLNCAAVPDTLLESELFGHARGAFSGAETTKPGLLETASGGTVFLDEVAELSASAQAKILRVLETGRFTRVGEVDERDSDVRFVAATNRDLEAEIATGTFRRDLYFRLNAATVWLPPLRDRPREIPVLAQTFAVAASEALGREPVVVTDEAIALLLRYRWPGNVRELKNVIDYLVAAGADDGVIGRAAVAEKLGVRPGDAGAEVEPRFSEKVVSLEPPVQFRPLKDELAELERTRIEQALAAAGGNQTRASELIAMPLRTFVSKLKKYGIAAPPRR